MAEPNSTSITWKWLVGILVVIVFAMTAAWARDITSRVALVETNMVSKEQFNRLEDKIDRLLGRGR